MKKFKVLLVNPPNSVPQNSDFVINIFQPLGLAYVAAMLQQHKINVEILDALAQGFDQEHFLKHKKLVGLDYQTIKEKIIASNPDVVGISVPFSFQSVEAHQVAKIVKSINPQILVITGGSHATIQPDDLLLDNNIDYVVRGEGEYVLLDIVIHIKKDLDLSQISGLSYKNKNGKIIHNPRSTPILKLDKLPNPARSLLPMEKYFQAAKLGRVIEGMLSFGDRRTSLITSRGCPFFCTFCSVNLTMTRVWRGRSPENVMAEIKECVEEFGIKYFDILDDNFTLDPARAKRICRLIIESKLKIKWSTPNGIRADKVDEELILLMKKAGCIQIKVAPESGSPEVLKNIIKKQLDLDKVKSVVSLCKKHHLSIEAFFVVGFPEESIYDIQKTISFAKDLRHLGCDYCYFFIATPYYGTEMYANAIAKGYLNKSKYNLNKILTTSNKSIIISPNFSHRQLISLLKLASRVNPPITKIRLISGLKMFFLDPKRILNYSLNYLKNFLP